MFVVTVSTTNVAEQAITVVCIPNSHCFIEIHFQARIGSKTSVDVCNQRRAPRPGPLIQHGDTLGPSEGIRMQQRSRCLILKIEHGRQPTSRTHSPCPVRPSLSSLIRIRSDGLLTSCTEPDKIDGTVTLLPCPHFLRQAAI